MVNLGLMRQVRSFLLELILIISSESIIIKNTYAIHRLQSCVAYTNPSHRFRRLQILVAITIGPRKKREQSPFVMLKSSAPEERLEQIQYAK